MGLRCRVCGCNEFEEVEGEHTVNKSISNDVLCALDLKAWLRAVRIGNKGEYDPFVLYQQGKISKGQLLNGIVDEVNSFIRENK